LKTPEERKKDRELAEQFIGFCLRLPTPPAEALLPAEIQPAMHAVASRLFRQTEAAKKAGRAKSPRKTRAAKKAIKTRWQRRKKAD